MSPGEERFTAEIGGRELSFSNLSKVMYPATGFTKGELIDYYVRIAPAMLPHLAGRPITCRRFPNGVASQGFIEKNVPKHAPGWIRTAVLARRMKGRDTNEYALVDDLASLVFFANLAAIEFHTPMWRLPAEDDPDPARADAAEAPGGDGEGREGGGDEAEDGEDGEEGDGKEGEAPSGADEDGGKPGGSQGVDARHASPDLIVFDLDPGAPAAIQECCQVALVLRERLATDGIELSPKTSGSKGMQLYGSIAGRGWQGLEANEYAHAAAEAIEADQPGLVVSRMAKALRTGKVLIDWSQNNPAKTTVSPYSLRAVGEPSVSTPLVWDEVAGCAAGANGGRLSFGPSEVLERVERMGDLFKATLGAADK
ncbi:MAG: DNA polymerase domain-containing protein [Acidimicrobiales bacterium]